MSERRAFGFKENRFQRAIREKLDGPDNADWNAELAHGEREAILNEKIAELTREGYQLQTSTGTSASLVSPAASPMGIGGFVAGVLTLGLAWVFTPVRRGKENDKPLYLEVKPNGVVSTTGKYGASQDYEHVPKR